MSEEVKEVKKISKYEPAPIAKRLFAGIMDGVIFLFTFFILALWVTTPIANAGLHYQDYYRLGERYQLASHLFLAEKSDDNGNEIIVDVKDSTGNLADYQSLALYYSTNTEPSFYIKRIYYYHHNFKTGVDIELPNDKGFDPINDHFVAPTYETPIDGILPKDYYTNGWFNENILRANAEDSYFNVDFANPNYLESITLKDESKKADAVNYLKNKAVEATNEMYYSSYYGELNNKIKAVQFFIFGVAFTVSYLVYFITIPVIFKYGETLGKKSMHISVISYTGYSAKKSQILFRELLLFVVIFLLGIVVGIGLTSLAIIALGVVLLFLGTLIPKNKRSVFDFAAYTIVVDSIHSTWFKNADDEKRHEAELEDNMSKYKKYIPDEEKLIQVGTEILDPELKKEVQKTKKSKKVKK